ncbi:MAG: ATP-binding cassette domain-containing protein [Porphyromonas sp.]|nr:ATP-binding cassette domain-containing protein [Porphyromonas sp.]
MSVLFRLLNADLGYSDGVILSGFDWEVARGERWAIVGPNGAGKTTLMRSILGLLPLCGGELHFYNPAGEQLRDRPTLGYLPQINHIDKTFPIDVAEVLRSGLYGSGLSRGEERARIAELLDIIDLGDYYAQPIGKLSGGQLQRVLLARALAARPELVVLDEPTSFLDKRYKEQFTTLLERLCPEEATVLMVTHDLPESEALRWLLCPVGQW